MKIEELWDVSLEGLKMIVSASQSSNILAVSTIAAIANSLLNMADGKVTPEACYEQMRLMKESLDANDKKADEAMEKKFANAPEGELPS